MVPFYRAIKSLFLLWRGTGPSPAFNCCRVSFNFCLISHKPDEPEGQGTGKFCSKNYVDYTKPFMLK